MGNYCVCVHEGSIQKDGVWFTASLTLIPSLPCPCPTYPLGSHAPQNLCTCCCLLGTPFLQPLCLAISSTFDTQLRGCVLQEPFANVLSLEEGPSLTYLSTVLRWLSPGVASWLLLSWTVSPSSWSLVALSSPAPSPGLSPEEVLKSWQIKVWWLQADFGIQSPQSLWSPPDGFLVNGLLPEAWRGVPKHLSLSSPALGSSSGLWLLLREESTRRLWK